MLNKQPIEARVKGADRLSLHSMFYTIQGEGPFSGRPAMFIRLAGCNLQCPACDTDYTKRRVDVTPDYISTIAMNRDNNPDLFVITGGEPFRQDITQLVVTLQEEFPRATVQIETNGALPLPETFVRDVDPDRTVIVVSPKTGHVHKSIHDHADAWKYVIETGNVDLDDGLPIQALQNELPAKYPHVARPPARVAKKDIYVSPMDAKDDAANERNMATVAQIGMFYGYTVGVQLHKILNLE